MSRNLNAWDVFWTNLVMMRQNVVGMWREGGAIRSLVNFRNLQFECARVFHKSLLT